MLSAPGASMSLPLRLRSRVETRCQEMGGLGNGWENVRGY